MSRGNRVTAPCCEQNEITTVDCFTVGSGESGQRNATVVGMCMACHTEQEIADVVGLKQPSIRSVLSEVQSFEIPIKPGDLAEVDDDRA